MGQYLEAENLKCKRTFVKKLIFLGPIVTFMIACMSGKWFQASAFNQWYMLLLPGYIALMAAMSNQIEEKKLNYRAVFGLPISLKKVWSSKILLMSVYLVLACLILFIGVVLGGFAFGKTVSIFGSFVGAILIAITSLWQIPLCLFLAKNLGIMGAVLINGGIGVVLNIFTVDKALWWLCPYSWTARSMCPIVKILPNGILAEAGDPLLNSSVIPIAVVLSLVLFIMLLSITANWFQKQEVK